MTRIGITENSLRISITKKQKINYTQAKKLMQKGIHLISEQNVQSAIIEIDNTCRVDSSALSYLERAIRRTNGFPVVLIGA